MGGGAEIQSNEALLLRGLIPEGSQHPFRVQLCFGCHLLLSHSPLLPWTYQLFTSFPRLNAFSQSTTIFTPQSTWWEGST